MKAVLSFSRQAGQIQAFQRGDGGRPPFTSLAKAIEAKGKGVGIHARNRQATSAKLSFVPVK